jgi:subtilisin family serine protease
MIALCFILAATHAIAAPEEGPADRSSQTPAFVPGELLVKFRAEVRKEAAADYREWFDISTRKTFAINGYQQVKLPEGADIEEALELYLEDPDVEHAEPNYFVHVAETTPGDAEFARLWGLHNTGQNVNGTSGTADADIDAPEAWDVTTGSSDVVVAVIDSGVDINHPDLQPNIWTNPGETPDNGIDDDGNGYIDDVNGWDFFINDNDPRDAHGHGTHVAGTIAAAGDNGIGVSGVSWSAKIMALRFLDAWGNGTTANAISAIEYASAMGADIINNSWGSSTYSPSQALKDAIEASGALVVCAAGNSGWNNDTLIQHYPSGYSSANIISVAASDQDDNRAAFSNYGPFSVDVAAPGTNIYSAAPGRETVWLDDFEDNNISNWTTGGFNDTWNTTSEEAFSGAYSLTDSPGTTYLNYTESWAYTPAIDLSDHTAAKLEFKIYGNAEADYDGLWVDASSNKSTWYPVYLQLPGNPSLGTGLTGEFTSWTTVVADLEAFDNENTVYVRFWLTSDDMVVRDGYYIDDVKITAASSSYSGDEYTFKSGTSMATPHVAGLAALIKAHNPALTVSEIKSLILSSADRIPSWNGLVATGGRVNAAAALAAPQISNVQVNSITETTAVVTWTTDKPSDSIVQYGTASSSWDSYPNSQSGSALVTGHSVTLSGLSQQKTYYFMVGSTDTYGNGPDNKSGDANPSAEATFTTADPDPPSIVQFPVINFAADTITVTYDESDMQGADVEGNYSFSPSMNFASANNDIADLGGSVYRLSMASIPAYEVFTLTVSNITDLAGNAVAPAGIRINDNDGDSMADDWEIANGLNPAVNDSAGDPDGDGYTNFQEYGARTNPRSAAETPFMVRDSIPGHNAGITNTQRVPNDTDFAVLLESVHGIDTTDNNSIEFTINDGVNPGYKRNLGDGTVRFVKLLTADLDNRITRMWVVYERSQESDDLQNFPYNKDVSIRVDASDTMANDMVPVSIDFNVETEAEHDAARDPANLPEGSIIAEGDPDLGALEDGIRIDSGDLEGAKVIYDSSEQRTPAFGPLNEIPPLSISGAGAVGVPMNLQPPTVFDIPVRIFIACPGYTDVSGLSVYYYNGSNWVRASDAAGNVLAGGEGWMVPGSRVNHNETDPATIEIQVYHFSGAQAGTFSAVGGGGGGGGGGGCFISTAACGSVLKHLLFYVLFNLALIGLGIYGLKKIISKP